MSTSEPPASEAATVDQIMNHEVYTVRTEESCGEVLGMILTLGITAAPVVDARGVPLGLVSLRNLARAQREDPVAKHMTSPPATIGLDATIDEAGREMGQLSYHHLVVVDEAGMVVGFVSSLDVIRGPAGLPARHPPAFPHQEPASGLSWSGTLALTRDNAQAAPAGPGMLVLTHADAADEVLWAEAASNLSARLLAFVDGEHNLPELVSERLGAGQLAFRVASFGRGGADNGPDKLSVIDVLLDR